MLISLIKKSIKSTSLILIIIFSLIQISCQETDRKSESVKSDSREIIKITMIPKSSVNPVFLAAKIGAMRTAESLNEKHSKIKVVIDWQPPLHDSPTEQSKIIMNSVANGSKAIIVSCLDEDSLTEAINFAVDRGVPVMTFDSDAPKSKRFAFYGPDDVEIGKILMNQMARLINGKGKIAILGGNNSARNLQKRVEGIKLEAANYPDIKIAGVYFHNETEADAINTMQSVMQEHPDLGGWVMAGGWPLFGDGLKNVLKPGELKIVAVDALPVQLKYLEENYVQLLLGQPVFSWGEVSVKTVVDKIYLKKDVNGIIKFNPIPVTIKNLGGWSRQLRAWGFTNIPKKYLLM